MQNSNVTTRNNNSTFKGNLAPIISKTLINRDDPLYAMMSQKELVGYISQLSTRYPNHNFHSYAQSLVIRAKYHNIFIEDLLEQILSNGLELQELYTDEYSSLIDEAISYLVHQYRENPQHFLQTLRFLYLC